jgi:RNA polymerase sigma-70 factor, ECF subfamily
VLEDLSDAELMHLLAEGREAALNALVHRWRDRLAAFHYQMSGDRGTALDLTQETFVRLYRHRENYQPRGAFQSWIFRIAGNLARDHARWRARRPTVPLVESGAYHIPDHVAGPDAAAASRDEIAAMDRAIASLPMDLRRALVLFVYEDLSHAEIAGIEECSAKAIETRIYRARQLLRQALEK